MIARYDNLAWDGEVHQLEVAGHLLQLEHELTAGKGEGAGGTGRDKGSPCHVLQGWLF